ncbi:MAG: 50S ribosomal protein L25 [Candidatus Hydrogenedens sp.]
MEIPVIKAQLRTKEGKSSTKKVRKEGNIPSVLYGMKEQTVPLKMDAKTFLRTLSHLEGKHPIVKLEIEGDAHPDFPAIIKEIQREPVTNAIIHVDFQKIRLDQKIHTSVPVVLVGQSEGVKMGGVLDHQLRELEIECLALQVPAHFEIDVTNLVLGHSIHVADITPPEGIKILTDPDRVVVSIHVPRTLEAKAATEEEKAEEGAEETKEAEEEKE